MTMTMTDLVWEDRCYESGWYICRVERRGEAGRLTVTLDGITPHLLHSQTVSVDRVDVDAWQRMCLKVIRNPSERNIEP